MLSLSLSSIAVAQTVDNGYYRVQNYGSARYCYLTDNKGSVSSSTTSVDCAAIELWKNPERKISDPSSVIYIKKVGSQYDLQAQGTTTHSIIGQYVNLYYRAQYDAYLCGGTSSGMTKYLTDGEASSSDDGWMCDGITGLDEKYRHWILHPVTLSDDEYFGVKPEVNVDGVYYKSFYAGFPFAVASEGMKLLYVTRVEDGQAVIAEVKDGKVPASTPIIVVCSSDDPFNNRLDIGDNNASKPAGSLLGGNYFMRKGGRHENLTPFNPATMRLLGLTAEGKIGFITPNEAYIPANSAYLNVPEGTPAELLMVTEDEFTSGIAEIDAETASPRVDNVVYTLSGVKVAADKDNVGELPAGIYIVGGKKIVVK